VQSQTGTNLSGLFPSTQYDITVTAYINGEGTPSVPVRITTGEEGPAAPSNLAVSADPSGNWRLGWDSCGTVQHGCVVAQSWTITPSFCDGRGVSSPPPAISVTADPTSKTQPPAVYRGNDNLLGRGLQFQVQGTGDSGRAGPPSAKSPCVYSWSPPIASAMRLTASQPANTVLGGSSATNVTLDLGPDPVRAVGGVGALVTFQLTGPDGTRTKGPIVYNGNGSALSASFDGVTPGATYTASATVRTAHGGASATLPPVEVTARADWPAITLSATCPATGVLHLSCDLTVAINGLSSAQVGGERFDTVDTDQAQSQLRCANQAQPLQKSNFDPSTDTITVSNLSLIFNHGDCTVTLVLKESASDTGPLVFGGTLSPVLSTDLTISSATTLDATGNDFGAAWITHLGRSAVNVTYTGPYDRQQVAQLTQSWTTKVLAPDGTLCATDNQQPDANGVAVDVDAACVNQFGADPGWSVSVTYTDAGTGNDHAVTPANPALTGTPPTYQPCTPAGFTAAWGTTINDGVTVTYPADADPAAIAGCSNWAFELFTADSTACGTPDSVQNPPAPNVIKLSCQTVPGTGWTVRITWRDTANKPQSVDVDVTGTPPTS
jgi:hypothetical protein